MMPLQHTSIYHIETIFEPLDVSSGLLTRPKSFAVGVPSQIPQGELKALPQMR